MNLSDMPSIPALTTLDILSNLTIAEIDPLTSNLITSSSIYTSGTYNLGNVISPYWNYSIDDRLSLPKVNITSNGIDMDNACDIKIGDFSLKESLERIEKQLGILRVNPELEKDWEELKELSERYRELEKNIHDKLNVWKILKNE